MHRYLISALVTYLAASNPKTPDRSALSCEFCWNSADELAVRISFTVGGEKKGKIHLTLNVKSHITKSRLDDLDDYVLQVTVSLSWLKMGMLVSNTAGL